LPGGITYEARPGWSAPGSALPVTSAPYIESLNARRYDFGGNVQYVIEKRYVVTARFTASSQHHDHRFGEIREGDRHALFFGEVAARGAFGRHTWVAGAAAEREVYIPRDVPRFAYRYT